MINALKHPAFFRPASRPTSPGPAHLDPAQADKNKKLALNSFRRPTPAPTPPPQTLAPSLIQDGTYLEMLSLKLSEAVSKALAQPAGPANPNELLAGKRPLPAGRGSALGAVITTELNASRTTPHLYRAILRSLHRPLSVLLNNLSSILLPLLASPAFLSPAAPTPQSPVPNATQSHALGIANFAEELLQVLDHLELGLNDNNNVDNARGVDGLKSIREGLVSLINKITTPLVTGIRNELIPLIESLERPAHVAGALTKAGSAMKLTTTTGAHHPVITQLQALVPLYARALTRYTSSSVAQPALANLLISVLWKALVALSNRADISPTPPPSPTVLPTSNSSSTLVPGLGGRKRRGSPSTTPPATPPASRFMLKLPPSRPPSPPALKDTATAAGDCKALLELINQLPRPSPGGSSKLASEAVDEAFKGLRALGVFLEVLQILKPGFVEKSNADLADDLISLCEELPTLIALPPLLKMYGSRDVPSVSEITGLSEEEYRRGILSGFGRAEECADGVGMRVRQRLSASPEANDVVITWLDLELDLH